MQNLYENQHFQESLENLLRPGKHILSEQLIEMQVLKNGTRVLDCGCGLGATLGYLKKRYDINGIGLDCSQTMVAKFKEINKDLECLKGSGQQLPFGDSSFDCVISECSLSLMENQEDVIEEVSRVLSNFGYWGIADLYARKPQKIKEFNDGDVNTCIKKLHNLEGLIQMINKAGFKIVYLEDISRLLKDLTIQLIFEYGSIKKFWMEMLGNNEQTACCSDWQNRFNACKPGYFMMIVQKQEDGF